MHWLGGSNFAGVRYGMAAGERAAWTTAIQFFGYGSMKETDAAGNITGSFSPIDLTFSGGYTHDLTDCLRGGFAVKVAYSSYSQFSAVAIAADLGLNYYDADRDLSLSVVAANLGGQVKRFNDTHERLPIDLRLGWAKSFGSFPVRFSITAYDLTRWKVPYYDNGDGTTAAVLKDSFGSNLMRHLVFRSRFHPLRALQHMSGLQLPHPHRYVDLLALTAVGLLARCLTAPVVVWRGVALAKPHNGATNLMVNFTTDLNELLR